MKIRVLLENTACRADLQAEHGLSLLLETGGKKILFDMGQSEAFAENARQMGVALSEVELAILSHGHYDHGGGLSRFLQENDHAPVWVHQAAFEPHFNARGRDIGLPRALREHPRLRFAKGEIRLGEALTLLDCGGWPLQAPVDSAGLCAARDGVPEPEDFRHEQYLLVRENGRRILISGCSHKGVLNIAAWFRPDVLVGGFHFKQLDPALPADARRLRDAAAALLEYPTSYYTGHCTGDAPYAFLRERMGERLHALSTGMEIEV